MVMLVLLPLPPEELLAGTLCGEEVGVGRGLAELCHAGPGLGGGRDLGLTQIRMEKSRIRETLTLSTDADRSTNTKKGLKKKQ